ncbi:nitroreductase family protein [Microbulbifer guangxiensis]|uniref:nitroreductase family protein n=1 Tax=Microbulbifer guangxiensis TaxID=2904249 RepID=UPI001F305B58|nr:nitroreductase family protein [Microbulbifer guangxiensis]
MDALEALHNRVSVGKLTDPAPSEAQRENIFRAALRTADHGALRPWRFLQVEGEELHKLGQLFLRAAEAENNGPLGDAKRDKTLAMPLRAPLILVAITRLQDHPKVPHIEQHLSTAGAVQAMLTAAFAQGIGAYWRTGPLAYNPVVAEGLGLAENEHIDGFIYLGTPAKSPRQARELATSDFFSHWKAP